MNERIYSLDDYRAYDIIRRASIKLTKLKYNTYVEVTFNETYGYQLSVRGVIFANSHDEQEAWRILLDLLMKEIQ